jgi:uncharacterized protein (DUF2236 family)
MPSPTAAAVNAERLLLLAWPRAILLQMAHPLIAAGVAEHSTFRAGPVASARRLHSTVRAMLALSFGDQHEAEGAIEGIRKIHRRVHGTLKTTVGQFPAGTIYSAEDPALVRWVHLTLMRAMPEFYADVIAPLSIAERDAYCEEAAWVPVALGAREADIPRTWADLVRAFDDVVSSGVLAAGDDARAIAEAVLTPSLPRGWNWMLGPVARLQRRIAIPSLPAAVRSAYGWSTTDEAAELDRRARARSVAHLRRLRRVLPDAIALWPDARPSRGRRQAIGARAESPSR